MVSRSHGSGQSWNHGRPTQGSHGRRRHRKQRGGTDAWLPHVSCPMTFHPLDLHSHQRQGSWETSWADLEEAGCELQEQHTGLFQGCFPERQPLNGVLRNEYFASRIEDIPKAGNERDKGIDSVLPGPPKTSCHGEQTQAACPSGRSPSWVGGPPPPTRGLFLSLPCIQCRSRDPWTLVYETSGAGR